MTVLEGALKAERMRLLRALAVGFALFAAGLALALAWLPEWKAGPLPDESFYVERQQELAARLGLQLAPEEPHARFTVPSTAYRGLGLPPSDPLQAQRNAISVTVDQGTLHDEGPARTLSVVFTRDGRPVSIDWISYDLSSFWVPRRPDPDLQRLERMARQLLAPGESLGEKREQFAGFVGNVSYKIEGSPSPESIAAQNLPGGISVTRKSGVSSLELSTASWLRVAQGMLLFALIGGLFFYLVVKGRIDLVNAAWLAAVTLLASDWAHISRLGGLFYLAPFWAALRIFLTWSVAESLMRSTDPDSTAGLDAVRAGRLGRRAGRAILLGFSHGAALAGFALAAGALCVLLPGVSPARPFLEMPFFPPDGDLLGMGIRRAAMVMLAITLLSRLLPARWATPAAILASPLFLRPVPLAPWPLEIAATLVFTGLLVRIARRFGLTALLTTAIVSLALPALAFTLLHARWIPVIALLLLAGVGYLVVRGFQGLSRPSEIEEVRPPAFVRREAEARRTAYELALLARIQVGLLPRELPAVPGFELAASSVLATEVGGDLYDFVWDQDQRLWIAAGDVAGHGYSCAVAQAMTKSALASLIPSGQPPAGVLGRLHRVLRDGGPVRQFTTLALLRLQPETGEAVLSNAGHPPPILLANGETFELTLPGLPLGQGPPRDYRELSLRLPPGSTIVFCSDGLYEAADANGVPYGSERACEVLRAAAGRTATEMLEELLEDWRRHRGGLPQGDDTTVVVVRRAERPAEGSGPEL